MSGVAGSVRNVSAGVTATPITEPSSEDEVKFFCLRENDWGFLEPIVLCYSEDDKELHVVDARATGQDHAELPLRRLKNIVLHEGE